MSELNYVPAAVPDDCALKISPSSFASFIERPWQWYRTQIQKLDVFEYNTSSVIGTIVHYCAEKVAKGEEVNEDAIEEYINSMEENDNYNREEARNAWYPMASTLINSYVMQEKETYLQIEEQVCSPIGDGFYVAGTLDVLQGTKEDCMITDYKTYNSKVKPKSISPGYRYQLLSYAAALIAEGYNVTRIRNVYINRNIDGGVSEKTGKPLKSYPPEVTVHTETVVQEDIDYINSMLQLCKDSVLATGKHPELSHIIWHDTRHLTNE